VRQRVDEQARPPHPVPPPRFVRAVLSLVALLTVAGLIGSALAPMLLLRSPLLLVALSPDARHVALAVGSAAPWELVAIAVLRRGLFSVGSFGLGVIYGPAAVIWIEQRSPRLGQLFRLLERLFARWGAPILLFLPFASLCVVAGAARTRFVAFLSATMLGHVLWVGSTYYIGALLSDVTDRVLAFLSSHLLESTLVCIAAVAVQQLIARRRAAKGPAPARRGEDDGQS
jgi:membrane protein DedA with SNARE-associated domain